MAKGPPADATLAPGPARLDVVIPVFNRLEMLKKCVESVRAGAGERLGSFVFVDDGSTEAGIEAYCRSQGKCIRHPKAGGFARSVNGAVGLVMTPFFVIMNSDVEATPGWLEPLASCLETRPEVGIAAPLLLFPTDSRDPNRPAGKVQSCGFATNIQGRPWHRLMGWSPESPRVREARDDLQGATGAVWAVRLSLWKTLKGFEPSFGAYFEDVDYCLRLRRAGSKIAYVPESVLYHRVGASYSQAAKEGGHIPNLQAAEALFFQRHQGKLVYDEWALI